MASFQQRMIATVWRHWEEVCRAAGAAAVQWYVDQASATARKHGITAERDVARIINIAFALGPRFEERYFWAGEFLRYDGMSASRRVDRMCELTAEELQRAEHP